MRPNWTEKIGVVMTGSNNDPEEWKKIIGTKAHKEELARKFKDNNDPMKIAIVVDMWLTGFDVPSLATMYIYKPMHGYNLMQAIARVNRVFKDKEGGLIVDYVGIASALKAAMKEYTKRDQSKYGDMNISQVIADVVKDSSQKDMLLEALSKADFNIKDIYVKNKKIEKQHRDAMLQFLTNMLGEGEVSEDLIPEDRPVIWITHASKSGETFDIEINDDSAGTSDIIDNIAEMLFINKEGGLFIEDELGRNYHTKLTEYFIELFNNKVNCGKAQLFFSTHDTKILNLLNPEQIYLVDKDEDGATYVKLLDDYLIREKDNIELGYLKGRYGAVPNIKE